MVLNVSQSGRKGAWWTPGGRQFRLNYTPAYKVRTAGVRVVEGERNNSRSVKNQKTKHVDQHAHQSLSFPLCETHGSVCLLHIGSSIRAKRKKK